MPTSPQGTIASAGRDTAGQYRVTQNNRALVSVAPGSIILPDTTRAFAVLADCRIEPLITLPIAPAGQPPVTMSGGGIRNPGGIDIGQNPAIGQAGLIVGPDMTGTAQWLVTGMMNLLGLKREDCNQARQHNRTVVIPPNSGPQTLENRNANGMNAEQAGNQIAASHEEHVKNCIRQWEQNIEWCGENHPIARERRACNSWAQEELWRCRAKQPPQPFRL